MSKNNETSGGVGFLSLLGLTFIVLKLCGVIAWSWWWVICPFWGPVALVIVFVICHLMIVGMTGNSKNRKSVGGRKGWQERLEQMRKDRGN